MEVLIGAIGSLIASIVLAICAQLFDFTSRKTISVLMELLYDSADSFDSAIESENVDVAEVQADRIIDYCIKIIGAIKPFTYLGKKGKLVYSLVYNIYYTTSYYKRIFVGYSGKEEQIAKLKKFKHKYYYDVNILAENNHIQTRSFLMVSVVVLQSLNNKRFVKNALKNNLYINEHIIKLTELYLDLIHPNNLKPKKCERYDLKNKTFTYKGYKTYIENKLKDS